MSIMHIAIIWYGLYYFMTTDDVVAARHLKAGICFILGLNGTYVMAHVMSLMKQADKEQSCSALVNKCE